LIYYQILASRLGWLPWLPWLAWTASREQDSPEIQKMMKNHEEYQGEQRAAKEAAHLLILKNKNKKEI